MTNKEKEWWLSVEDRFNRTYKFRGMPGYELRHVQMCEDILSFFHKEIQNRLHEEGKEELEEIEPLGSVGRYFTKREIERAKELEQEKANSVDSELPK